MDRESGQTTIEYGLVLVIFSIAVIAMFAVVAGSVTELYSDAQTLIHEAIA